MKEKGWMLDLFITDENVLKSDRCFIAMTTKLSTWLNFDFDLEGLFILIMT